MKNENKICFQYLLLHVYFEPRTKYCFHRALFCICIFYLYLYLYVYLCLFVYLCFCLLDANFEPHQLILSPCTPFRLSASNLTSSKYTTHIQPQNTSTYQLKIHPPTSSNVLFMFKLSSSYIPHFKSCLLKVKFSSAIIPQF